VVVSDCVDGCIVPGDAPVEPIPDEGEVEPPPVPVDDPPIIPTAWVAIAIVITRDRVNLDHNLNLHSMHAARFRLKSISMWMRCYCLPPPITQTLDGFALTCLQRAVATTPATN
jgi:hypothetical protein